jgi:hypothetical protein
MEELAQGYNISAAGGSAATAKSRKFRLGGLDCGITAFKIGA